MGNVPKQPTFMSLMLCRQRFTPLHRPKLVCVQEAIGAMEDLMDFSRNSAKPGFDP